jgi:hypothetical protein
MRLLLGLCSAALIAGGSASAHASSITRINFTGHGVVTFITVRESDGIVFTPPATMHVGDPVIVGGSIWFGDGTNPDSPLVVPIGFTGAVTLDPNAIVDGLQAFRFDVAGGATGVNTLTEVVPLPFASVTLVNGRLTGLSLTADEDGEVVNLETSSFRHAFGIQQEGTTWGGTWQLNVPVPEPAAWAMMLTGFVGIGAILRRRRRAEATPS